MPEESAILDRDVIDNLRQLGDGEELLREMTNAFLADSHGRLQNLRESLANGDAQRLTQTTHAFKGSAATMGATMLARSLARAEECARAGDLSAMPRLLEDIEGRFSESRKALLAEVSD